VAEADFHLLVPFDLDLQYLDPIVFSLDDELLWPYALLHHRSNPGNFRVVPTKIIIFFFHSS